MYYIFCKKFFYLQYQIDPILNYIIDRNKIHDKIFHEIKFQFIVKNINKLNIDNKINNNI